MAAVDAAAALHHLGYSDALESLEKSTDYTLVGIKKQTTSRDPVQVQDCQIGDENAEVVITSAGETNSITRQEDENNVTPSLKTKHSDEAGHEPYKELECPKISVNFKYSLLCYAGALLQEAPMQRDEEACRCYSLAQNLMPHRLEAHINLGNLLRRRMQYLGCLDAYIAAVKVMLEEEEAASGSKYVVPQRQLLDFVVHYRKELMLHLDEKRKHEAGNVYHMQGEMLLLGEQFRKAGEGATRPNPFDEARRKLMQEAEALGNSLTNPLFQNLLTDPKRASRLIAPYTSALDRAFAVLALEFKEEAVEAAHEIASIIGEDEHRRSGISLLKKAAGFMFPHKSLQENANAKVSQGDN